nr:cupin domain-containing protein [uncultured Duganella sp.]
MQGQVRVTDEAGGQSRLFEAGDSWFVTKGTSTVWEVLTDGYTKHYLAL